MEFLLENFFSGGRKIHFKAFQIMQSSGPDFTYETPETKVREEGGERDSGYHEEERLLHSTPRHFRARVRRPTKLQFSAENQNRLKRPAAINHIYLKLLQYSVRGGRVQNRKVQKRNLRMSILELNNTFLF